MNKGFADLCLTTWLRRHTGKNNKGGKDEAVRPSSARLHPDFVERETRFELATLALARRCSTTELLPLTKKKPQIPKRLRKCTPFCTPLSTGPCLHFCLCNRPAITATSYGSISVSELSFSPVRAAMCIGPLLPWIIVIRDILNRLT